MKPLVTRRAALALLAGAGAALSLPAFGSDLGQPSGAPILTVTGKIRNTNDSDRAVLDRAMLESLGMDSVTTHTPWYKSAETFQGVRLSKLMAYVGAFGDRVLVSALNDYSSELPLNDFTQYGTLLALKRDGAYLPVSDKGPLFVIYPFDAMPQLKQDKFYMRSVWQVSEMEVR